MSEPRAPRLRAELTTSDGTVVRVSSVPAPPSATAGKLRVSVPYPADAPEAVIAHVKVVNDDLGTALSTDMHPMMVIRPGDTLNLTFGQGHAGDAPGAGRTEMIAANLASLNEIIAELTAKVSDDPEFTAMVRELLREHSHALGYQFQGE